MADAVREALADAVSAAWPGDEIIYADEHTSPETMIAAAIAAFLRARARRAAKDRASMIPIEWMHEAAAAVERAAEGRRDG